MATIKVSSCEGVKFLACFDTLSEVAFYQPPEIEEPSEPEEKNPFE